MVYLSAGLQTLPPIYCQCVKCQHGRVHWLSSHKNMPSSRVTVFDAPPCEGKHIKHIHAHVICARLRSNRVCILFDKRCEYFRASFYLGCWINVDENAGWGLQDAVVAETFRYWPRPMCNIMHTSKEAPKQKHDCRRLQLRDKDSFDLAPRYLKRQYVLVLLGPWLQGLFYIFAVIPLWWMIYLFIIF